MEGGEIGSSSASDETHPTDSISQPLLFNPAPQDSSPIEEYSENPPPISLLRGPRPFRDILFLVLFLLSVVSTFVFGFCAVAFRNPDYSNVSSFSFDSASSSCVRHSSSVGFLNSSLLLNFLVRHLYLDDGFLKDGFPLDYLVWSLSITLILAFPILLLILYLLNRFPKQIVYSSIPFFVLIPSFLNLYWFISCTLSDSCKESFPLVYRILALIFFFIMISLISWIIFANWHRIELTCKILGVSAHALSQNLGLLAVLPSFTLCLLLFFIPVVPFLVFATQNGKIVPKVSTQGHECTWKQHKWVPAYFSLSILTMLWSFTTMIEAQVFVISGTIARWYFSTDDERPRRTIRDSLRNAFGPSFGTVCFSGMVRGFIRSIRAIHDSAKHHDHPHGIMDIMIKCCADFLLSSVHFVNKFTINFTAITGDGYCSSARMAYELLKRNLLSVVFVETVSTRILIGIGFVFSSVYAILAWVILRSLNAPRASSYLAAGSSFILLMAVLGFLILVLDEVIDTVYMCFAIDRDKGEVSKQEVHSVYILLPVSRSSRAVLPSRSPLLA